MDDESGSTSRRRVIAASVAALAGLAGCSGDGSDGGTPTDDETSTDGGSTPAEPTATTGGTTTDWPDGIESEPLPDAGDDQYLDGLETYEVDDASHVRSDTEVDYDPTPPVGGPHYGSVVNPGVYEEPQPLGALVHNLEHGAVVVYYDPAEASDPAMESLRRFAAQHTDPWAHVIVVPTPVDDPAPYVLTAWGALLRMERYDPRVVRAFLAEYLGRGPENPVR